MALYIVATPIGNLNDITFRGIDALKEVDLILSEDTRETQKLLKKFDIKTPQISYREENHDKVIDRILSDLEAGKDLALVSDSGTPAISDPGFRLIRKLYDKAPNNHPEIIPVPGPSAVTTALSVSGLPTDNFVFLGFLPRKTSQRSKILVKYGDLKATLIIYESPYRVKKLLKEIYENLGNREVCLAKDLTKMYEKVETKPVQDFLEVQDQIKEKGEYVVLVGKEGYKIA
jgi:16S rRNA (cytidine1402-2'-O)-methyltransferase